MKPSDTSSEEFRMLCEARHVYALRRKSHRDAHAYLEKVRQARGDDAWNSLKWHEAKLWEKT